MVGKFGISPPHKFKMASENVPSPKKRMLFGWSNEKMFEAMFIAAQKGKDIHIHNAGIIKLGPIVEESKNTNLR